MKKNLAFLLIVILSISVLSLHFIALNFFLYWHIWWFDLLVHFLAGALASTSFIWFFRDRVRKIFPTTLFVSSIFTLAVGIVWETFEYVAGLTFSSSSYALDTSLDILLTFIGGLVVSVYFLSNLTDNKLEDGQK